MSDRYLSLALTAFLLALVLAMAWMALDFNPQARQVPLVVAVPTALALALQLVREVLGLRLGAEIADGQVADDEANVRSGPVLDESADARAAKESESVGATESTAEKAAAGTKTERTEIGDPKASAPQAFTWILVLGLAFYVFGMMATVPLFLIPFMRIYGSESWKVIAGIVLGTMAVLHLLFVVLLEVQLYVGLVGEWLDL